MGIVSIEIGVLIGNFSGVDDPGAQKALEEIKFSTPHCLDPQKTEKSTIVMAGFREFNRQVLLAAGKGDRKKGPMSHAFIVPNPLIDHEDMKDSLDPFVVRLNKGVENSLLECPGEIYGQGSPFHRQGCPESKRNSSDSTRSKRNSNRMGWIKRPKKRNV